MPVFHKMGAKHPTKNNILGVGYIQITIDSHEDIIRGVDLIFSIR